MRHFFRLLAFILAVTLVYAAQQPTPRGLAAALERWKAGFTVGDDATVQSLYSSNPPAYVLSSDGKQQLPISSEIEFWRQTRAAGMIGPATKVVSTEDQQGLVVVKIEVSFRSMTAAGTRERYVLEQQGWQQQAQGWRMVDSSHTPVLKMRPVGKLNPHLYQKNADAKAEIRAALAKAARTHKRVLLDFGGNWCYDCHVLEAAFHQADVSPLVAGNFIVVHVDIGQMDKNLDMAQKYKVLLDRGVPALAVLAPDGTLLYSQQHGEFESARNMDPDDLIAFLKKWKPARAQ